MATEASSSHLQPPAAGQPQLPHAAGQALLQPTQPNSQPTTQAAGPGLPTAALSAQVSPPARTPCRRADRVRPNPDSLLYKNLHLNPTPTPQPYPYETGWQPFKTQWQYVFSSRWQVFDLYFIYFFIFWYNICSWNFIVKFECLRNATLPTWKSTVWLNKIIIHARNL